MIHIGASSDDRAHPYNGAMEPSPELEAYLELCKRIYLRMEREGTWPWSADSTNPEDVIDSSDHHDDV